MRSALSGRSRGRRRSASGHNLQEYRPHSRGRRRELSDGGLRSRPAGNVERRYTLTNPGSSTPVAASAAFLGASFDDPVHTYRAMEVTLDRRLANNWSLLASAPVVAASRQLRGILPGRQRSVRSRHHIAATTSRPTTPATPRSVFRSSATRGHPLSRADRHPAARSAQQQFKAVRQLCPAEGCQRRCRLQRHLRRAADAAGRGTRTTTTGARSRRRRAVPASRPWTASERGHRS